MLGNKEKQKIACVSCVFFSFLAIVFILYQLFWPQVVCWGFAIFFREYWEWLKRKNNKFFLTSQVK